MNTLSPAHLVILAIFLVLLVVLVLLLVWAIRGSNGNAQGRAGYQEVSARSILDRRYANGELSREDYLRIKEDITEVTVNRDA